MRCYTTAFVTCSNPAGEQVFFLRFLIENVRDKDRVSLIHIVHTSYNSALFYQLATAEITTYVYIHTANPTAAEMIDSNYPFHKSILGKKVFIAPKIR